MGPIDLEDDVEISLNMNSKLHQSRVEAAKEAIGLAGGATELARRLSALRGESISVGRITKWLENGVSVRLILDVERITGVSRRKLDREIYP